MILPVLRRYSNFKGDNLSLLQHDDIVEWYNTISLTTISHVTSRLARAIAKTPFSHIIYVRESDNIGQLYCCIRLSLMLLSNLLILSDNDYELLLADLNANASQYGFVDTINRVFILHDGSYFRFDGIQ